MLDDLKFIHERDAQDAFGIAQKAPEQLLLTYTFEGGGLPGKDFKNVVVAGMGGSALPAELVKTWPGSRVPFELTRTYTLPGYVNEDTLVIVSSYSGNTEETLAALNAASQTGATIAVIAAGGALVDQAREKHHPLIVLPNHYQPRHAVFASFKALITILKAAKIVDFEELELAAARTHLDTAISAWVPTIPQNSNPAKQLAVELAGKSPVIYASTIFYPSAYKWKIDINENAKNVAWCNQFSEFNHNEFIGWSSHPAMKPYGVVFLESNFDHPQIQKRFAVSEKLLSGTMPAPYKVQAVGDTVFEQMLWFILLGDFVSLYLAMLNNVNPTPVELVEKLKTELG